MSSASSARRPVETVVKDGAIVSGFSVGRSVFDLGLVQGPPPYFLAVEESRFFETVVEK
jgi:hypothetical protein